MRKFTPSLLANAIIPIASKAIDAGMARISKTPKQEPLDPMSEAIIKEIKSVLISKPDQVVILSIKDEFIDMHGVNISQDEAVQFLSLAIVNLYNSQSDEYKGQTNKTAFIQQVFSILDKGIK